jgi:hypothetical protein
VRKPDQIAQAPHDEPICPVRRSTGQDHRCKANGDTLRGLQRRFDRGEAELFRRTGRVHPSSPQTLSVGSAGLLEGIKKPTFRSAPTAAIGEL